MRQAVLVGATAVVAIFASTSFAQQSHTAVTKPKTVAAAQNAFILTHQTLTLTQSQRATLVAAKARPTAVALRATLAKRPVAAFNLTTIDKSHVPVLVAARPELANSVRVYAALDRYTASARKGAMVYEINGTRLPAVAPAKFRLPGGMKTLQPIKALPGHAIAPIKPLAPGAPKPPPPKPEADPGALQDVHLDHTESGIDVTFTRFGHIYNVSIDCGGPAEDESESVSMVTGQKAKMVARTKNADCTDASALAFVQGLEVVGGGQP